jgi:hypothetical protein
MDLDFDQHGDPNNPLGVCGNAGDRPPPGLVASSDDCCDRHPDMFPGQTALFSTAQRICPDELPFDYDCNGRTEGIYQAKVDIVGAIGRCVDVPLEACAAATNGAPAFTTWFQAVPACGESAPFAACQFVNSGGIGVCNSVAGGALIVNTCK